MTPLAQVQNTVAGYMDRIKTLFKPGVRITVLARTPGHPDRDFLMTDDSTAEIVAAVQRREREGATP